MEPTTSSLKWYQKTSGILFAGCGGLALVMVLVVVGMVFHYYRTIISGNGAELATKFAPQHIATAGFTTADGSSGDAGSDSMVDRTTLEQGDFPTLGSNTAKLTIVEFVDFKCPNCETAYPIMRQLIKEHGADVKIISRNSPFESLHPGTTRFAQIAWCAEQQKNYWAVHDYFFENQANLPVVLSPDDLGALAGRFGLDPQKLSSCLTDQRSLIAINKDYTQALSLGVRGTPTFFINGQKVEGVVPYSSWEELLQSSK